MSTVAKQQQQQQYRRGKPNAPPPPAFADVTASVAAASFAARRLPELHALYQQQQQQQQQQQNSETPAPRLLDTQGFCSGGGKASSRHLRRRATSFRPRQRHRSGTAAGGKSRRAQRRNKALLLQKHETWMNVRNDGGDDDDDDNETNNKTVTPAAAAVHWIPTHLWHSKRFCMQNLWHWQVPIQHSNRGARAVLRLATTHALVQDVTWRTQPVWWVCCRENWTACRQALDRILAHMDDDNQNYKDEVRYDQGMLHRVDQHPLGAIGPVSYLIQSGPLLNKTSNDEDGGDDGIYIYLWGHASIQDQLWQQVRAVLTQGVCAQGPCRGIPGGLACLQIRGKNPSTCLATSLDLPPALKATIDETYEKNLGSSHKGVVCVGQDLLCLVRRPRDASLPCNLGVCGWDVLGSSVRIRELFLQCVIKGGACPVGLVEESALQLEAQPPLAVFPRDYGDTAEGESFWQPETASSSSSSDWALLREHDSGTTGRVRTSPLTDTTVSWAEIVEAPSMVLVRGSFLKPFLDAWRGLECSLTERSDGATTGQRITKKRRKVVDPAKLRKIPQPSAEQRAAHESYCVRLQESLTLPAALLCHIKIDGPGRIDIGAPLYRYGGDIVEDEPLGYATSGAFSPSRGAFHGTAVVGAKSLLVAIGNGHYDNAAVTRPRESFKSQRALLLIMVGNEGFLASLSLLV